jgi:hypothetical protein
MNAPHTAHDSSNAFTMKDLANAMHSSSGEEKGGGQKGLIPLREFQLFVGSRPLLAEYFGHVFGVSILHSELQRFDPDANTVVNSSDGEVPAGKATEGGGEVPVLSGSQSAPAQ